MQKKFNIKNFTTKLEIVENETDDSLILALRQSRVFVTLPSWIENWAVPADTIASNRSGLECYNILLSKRKEAEKIQHPVYKLDRLVTTTSVTFTPVKVVENTGDKTTHTVKRGFLSSPDEGESTVLASAFSANMLAYYTKGNDKGKVSAVIPRDRAVSLGIVSPDLVPIRLASEESSRSSTLARDNIFMMLKDDSYNAMFVMSKILTLFPGFSEEQVAITPNLHKYLKTVGIDKKSYVPALVPKTDKILVCTVTDYRLAWNFLHNSRQVRGADGAGIGTLTNGYYFFEMSRTMAKYISYAYDFMNMLNQYKVKVLYITAPIQEYVVRILVANGYSVVYEMNMSLRAYADEPGYYRTVGAQVPVLKYLNLTFADPIVRATTVDWPSINMTKILKPKDVKLKNGAINKVYSFCYCYLVPDLEKTKELISYFPSTMPHNGRILAGSCTDTTYPLDKLIRRFAHSNSYRNSFPFNRTSYATIDPFTDWIKPLRAVILPRMTDVRTKEDFFRLDYSDAVKEDGEKIVFTDAQIKKFEVESKVEPVSNDPDECFCRFSAKYSHDLHIPMMISHLNQIDELDDYVCFMSMCPANVSEADWLQDSPWAGLIMEAQQIIDEAAEDSSSTEPETNHSEHESDDLPPLDSFGLTEEP
jgi:hypothetical protein